MRILQINKFYHESGGAERYLFSLSHLLEAHGHTVIPFAVHEKQTKQNAFQKYFISPINTDRVSFGWGGMRTAGRFLWSFEAAKKLDALLTEYPVDVAHLHNIYHQISPSILPVLKRHGVPVVMTLHDFHLVSPAYNLYAHGGLCTHTRRASLLHAVMHRCVKESRVASALCAAELSLHRFMKIYERGIQHFIAPSQAALNLYEEWGWRPPRAVVVPNFVDLHAWHTSPPRVGNVLFVGRLIPDKGTRILAQIIGLLPDVRFTIVGDGPDRSFIESLSRTHANVMYRGPLSVSQIQDAYRQCGVVIMPSLMQEICPMVLLEAYAAGRGVIASEHTSFKEFIKPKTTGILVSAGDAYGFAGAIQQIIDDHAVLARMGEYARTCAETRYSADIHYEKIIELYTSTLTPSKSE